MMKRQGAMSAHPVSGELDEKIQSDIGGRCIRVNPSAGAGRGIIGGAHDHSILDQIAWASEALQARVGVLEVPLVLSNKAWDFRLGPGRTDPASQKEQPANEAL